MDGKKIEVPVQVIMDIEKVRINGRYNMFEAQNVFNELYMLGCYETVNWLFDENWEEGSYRSQVNINKYMAALEALSDTKKIASILSE